MYTTRTTTIITTLPSTYAYRAHIRTSIHSPYILIHPHTTFLWLSGCLAVWIPAYLPTYLDIPSPITHTHTHPQLPITHYPFLYQTIPYHPHPHPHPSRSKHIQAYPKQPIQKSTKQPIQAISKYAHPIPNPIPTHPSTSVSASASWLRHGASFTLLRIPPTPSDPSFLNEGGQKKKRKNKNLIQLYQDTSLCRHCILHVCVFRRSPRRRATSSSPARANVSRPAT